MKPKVILDIGFLGHAYDEPTARRGAQREIQYLFDGLIAANECELSFVGTSHLAGVYDFLESKAIDPKKNLFFDSPQLLRSRLGRKLTRAVHRTMDDNRFCARARRKALATAATLSLRAESKISRESLDTADIFHSPHSPFPESVQRHPHIKKFLTCLDFIPLKNPEFFPGDSKPFINGVLSCLQPQNFAFCISETTRADVLNFSRMLPEHIFVTPLAADPKIFHPVTEPEILLAARKKFNLGDAPYLLALSAHDRHKNFVHLIECFGALVESGELTSHNLVIVGPNPGRNPTVREAISRFPRAQPRIIISGFVPDEDLAAIYAGATAFLFPSLAEGFGIPPLEAMQCGTPVIASNAPAIPEVVGNAGILLPPTDRDEWCQAILKIIRDANLRAQLSEQSLARAKLFTWQRFIEETLRGYRASLHL